MRIKTQNVLVQGGYYGRLEGPQLQQIGNAQVAVQRCTPLELRRL